MSAHVTWDGLAELQEALRNLPRDLAGEASRIVESNANGAAVAVRTIYGQHRRSGNLQDHVTVDHQNPGPFGAGAIVKSTARHAWLFDNGSQARHWASGKSTGQMWGKTPPTHAFVRTMIRFRRLMYSQLKDLLVRHGLTVSGDI